MQSCSLILVAHNPIIRAGIHALLRDVPDIPIVGEFVDQQALVAQLTEQCPQVVLICLDPELDQIGTELIQLCKMMQPACKVLVLAHNQHPDKIRRYLLAGTDGYLLYGVEQTALAKAIRDVVQYGLVVSEPVAQVIRGPMSTTTATTIRASLSAREQEVLKEVARGRSNGEIAQHLHISVDTVRTHLKHIYEKLHIEGRAALIQFAVQVGLFPSQSDPQ